MHCFGLIKPIAVAATLATALLPLPAFAGPFGDWAAAVVAADFRAHSGADTEVFDNARRDIAEALIGIGFDPARVWEFSVRPERYPDMPLETDLDLIAESVRGITQMSGGGCFFYFTSHGAPDGLVFGDFLLPPEAMAAMIDETCAERPTVVIVSACYSGVFIPALAADNRMILTAARPDRSSFGCSEDLEYTFFDQCVLQSLSSATTFAVLALRTRACVGAREQKENVSPPSEPQLFVGNRLEPQLSYYTLTP
jgi:hypothetical protein